MDIPLEIEFGRAVKRLFLSMENYSNRLLHPFGLTNEQWRILFLVNFYEGCDQQFIADEMFKVKSAITAQLAKMGKFGLIARIPDEKDNRSKRVYLTDKGREMVTEGLSVLTENCGQFLQSYPDEDIEQMIAVMQELTDELIKEKNKFNQERSNK